jgi:hypothetical protein
MTRARVLIGSTVVALVAYVVATVAEGNLPKAKDSPAQVADWFVRHGDDVRLATWFAVIALAAMMVVVGITAHQLPGSAGTVFLVGGILTGAGSMISMWFTAGLALHAGTTDPATARTLLDVVAFYGPVLTASTVVMIAPTVYLAWHGDLPRWLGAIAAIALVEQLVETVTVFGKNGFTEPGGAMNLQLGAGLYVLWLAATAVAVARREVAAPAADVTAR